MGIQPLLQGLAPAHCVTASRCSILAACLCLVACDEGGRGAESPSGGGSHPLVGSPAPEFDLPAQAGGKRASLEDAKGKVVLVDFWATWCGPCRASFPKYQALTKKYEDDVVVLALSEDDEADGIADFAKDTGVSFTLAWDRDKRVAGTYHPSSMPTSFIVDKSGLVRFVHSGFREGDERVIEGQIKGLLE